MEISRSNLAKAVLFIVDVDGDVVMGDAFVPAGQGAAGWLLNHGLLGIVASERAHGVHAGEERDGGEHHLSTVLVTAKAGTAEAGDTLEVLG